MQIAIPKLKPNALPNPFSRKKNPGGLGILLGFAAVGVGGYYGLKWYDEQQAKKKAKEITPANVCRHIGNIMNAELKKQGSGWDTDQLQLVIDGCIEEASADPERFKLIAPCLMKAKTAAEVFACAGPPRPDNGRPDDDRADETLGDLTHNLIQESERIAQQAGTIPGGFMVITSADAVGVAGRIQEEQPMLGGRPLWILAVGERSGEMFFQQTRMLDEEADDRLIQLGLDKLGIMLAET